MADVTPTGFKAQFLALRNIPELFTLIWRTNRMMMLGNLILRFLKSLLPVSQLYVAKLIIDEVVQLQKHDHTATQLLWTLVAIELGLGIVSEVISRAISLIDSLLGDLFSNQTSVAIIEKAATLDLYQFEDPTFYDKLDRARRQTTGRTVLMSLVFEQLQDLITIFFLATALVIFNPWLLLMLLIAVIPSFLGETHFNRLSYSLTLGWTPERRELDYLRYIGASDETAKEIKVFGLANFLSERFKRIADKYYLENKKLAVRRAFVGTLLSSLGTVAYYFAYVFMLLQTIVGVLSLGSLTFLASSFRRMSDLLQTVMNRFSRIADNALYLQDYFDFLDIQPTMVTAKNGRPVPNPFVQGFEFQNVSFKYLNSEKYAVRNLNFTLQAGQKLALVGENGAGKTTVVKLLARLYEPSEGRILLDGFDLAEYDATQLRESVSIIFQDFIRFQLQAAENVAIGNIEQLENRTRIENASQKSLADDVIEKLPAKYEQMLGKRFHNGVDLSGGQWQKVALARAYMRDAQLLILDEPTAALDARAEHEVFIRFAELTKGKTAVLISHRFSTVRMADNILFLENGTAIEFGTHQSLMEKGGKYAELFELQARGYV